MSWSVCVSFSVLGAGSAFGSTVHLCIFYAYGLCSGRLGISLLLVLIKARFLYWQCFMVGVAVDLVMAVLVEMGVAIVVTVVDWDAVEVMIVVPVKRVFVQG